MNIKRLNSDLIFVKENQIQSGTIVLPDHQLGTSWICDYVGPDCKHTRPGDIVLLGRGHLGEHRIGDVTYKVIRESDIQAYVE